MTQVALPMASHDGSPFDAIKHGRRITPDWTTRQLPGWAKHGGYIYVITFTGDKGEAEHHELLAWKIRRDILGSAS